MVEYSEEAGEAGTGTAVAHILTTHLVDWFRDSLIQGAQRAANIGITTAYNHFIFGPSQRFESLVRQETKHVLFLSKSETLRAQTQHPVCQAIYI